MKIDRTVQVKILEALAEYYPDRAPDDLWKRLVDIADNNEKCLRTNLFYLIESGCIKDNCLSKTIGSPGPIFHSGLITLTNTGQDYIAKDGGITAFKNTVTVRFHEEAVATLERYIHQSTESPEKKTALSTKLRQLSFAATEHLLKKLLDAAVLRSPEVFQLIEKALL